MKQDRKETKRGRKTRLAIAKAATELMCQHGFSGTSIEMICSRAKVVKTAIYWHFGSKAGLVAALIDDVRTDWVQSMADEAGQADTPKARMDKMMSGFRDLIENRSHMLRLIELVISEAAHLDAELLEAVRSIRRSSLDAIKQGFEQSIGVAVPGGDAFAQHILDMMHGVHRIHLLYGGEVDLEPYFEEMRYTINASVQARLRRL